MDKRSMTCIICPRGCRLTVTHEDKKMISCEGNFCKRGASYAEGEISNPVRTLTTTVRTASKLVPMLPVKTSQPIHKDKLFDAMNEAAKLIAAVPVRTGDIIATDFIEPGISLVAGRSIDK